MARIFWDTNLFIYLFEHNAEWSTRVIEFRQRMVARGDELLTSCLTLGEALTKPKETGNTILEKSYLNFFANGPIELIAFEVGSREAVCRNSQPCADSTGGRDSTRLRSCRPHRSFRHERQPALRSGRFGHHIYHGD